jgi:hypothetical protein
MWRAQHRDADKPFKTQVEIRDELYGAKPGGSRRAEMKPPDPSTTALALPAHARSQLLASRRRALIDKSKATQDDATTTKWGDSNKPDLSTGSWSEHIVTSLLNPTVKDTQNIRVTKKALSPVEHDLLNDRYAPRAFAHAARNMSGTFGHVTLASSGFVGSVPRHRSQYRLSYQSVRYDGSRPKSNPYLATAGQARKKKASDNDEVRL